MNGLTNRQVALQMAIEYRKGKVDNSPETVLLQADEFYNWLEQENKEKEK